MMNSQNYYLTSMAERTSPQRASMQTAATPTGRAARAPARPPLLVSVLAYGVPMIVSVILLASDPPPSASAASVLACDKTHHTPLEFAGCFGFAASRSIWTATVSRMRPAVPHTRGSAAVVPSETS